MCATLLRSIRIDNVREITSKRKPNIMIQISGEKVMRKCSETVITFVLITCNHFYLINGIVHTIGAINSWSPPPSPARGKSVSCEFIDYYFSCHPFRLQWEYDFSPAKRRDALTIVLVTMHENFSPFQQIPITWFWVKWSKAFATRLHPDFAGLLLTFQSRQ